MKRKPSPASAGLVVIATTILGWIGCDSLSKMADKTADLLNKVPQIARQVSALDPSSNAGAATSTTGSGYTYPQPSPYSNAGAAPLPGTAGPAPAVQTASTATYQPFLTIGSFNIQVFGQSKVRDAAVMSYLVDIAKKFDILAIQEIRDEQQTALPAFVQMINRSGGTYAYLVGPREGATTSKEQFAFIYNTQRLTPLNSGYTVSDPRRRMNRNPFAATFQCIPGDQRSASFTFTLVAVHTDPDVVPLEMEALAEVWQIVRRSAYEDDVILLGDFNASPVRFGPLAQVPNLFAAIPPELPTNVARTACYDNIVFDRYATSEFARQSGVFDIANYYGLTAEQVALISDHMPIWAVFSMFETTANVAGQGVRVPISR
jgi:endonuclease/exonuclease/phosphatase family metal-dependent hydrolase